MRTFHQYWFWVATLTTAAAGLWAMGLAVTKREPPAYFIRLMAGSLMVMLVQVLVGVWLWQSGLRPGNEFHLFYGVVIAFTLSLAYVYRIQLERRPAVSYGILLLFVMGLGLRAWSFVG